MNRSTKGFVFVKNYLFRSYRLVAFVREYMRHKAICMVKKN